MTANGHAVTDVQTQGQLPGVILHYRTCHGRYLSNNIVGGSLNLLMFTHSIGIETSRVSSAEAYMGFAGIAEAPIGAMKFTRLFRKYNPKVYITVETSLSDGGNYDVYLGKGELVAECKDNNGNPIVLNPAQKCLYMWKTPHLTSGVSHNLEAPECAGMRDELLLKAAKEVREEYLLDGVNYEVFVWF